MYYQIRIIHLSEVGARFMLSAAPQQAPGGSMPAVTLETWDKLAAALGSVNIGAGLIDEAREKAVEKGEAFNILGTCF